MSQQVQQQVSIMFTRQVSDPRMAGANVTRVETSGDRRFVKIFVAPIKGDAEATDEMMAALDHATSFFRREIARNLDLKFAPEIRFLLDRAIEKGEHFLEVLEQIQHESSASAPVKPARDRKNKKE
jgi:ribosome-binding factor A